jgi:putative ABC transport system permease protein
MGPELMQRYHWKVGDTVTLTGGSVDADFPVKIEGVLRFSMLGDNFLMHHGYFRAVYCDCETVPTNVIFFRVEDRADVAAVRRAVAERFRGEPVQVELITLADFVSEIVSQAGDASRLVFLMVVIIGLATLLVVANMLAMSMRERSRDIAVLRSLGFHARHVAELVLGEAGLIALLGSILGGAAAYAAFHATGFSLRMGAQSYFTVGGLTVLESVTAGLLMGLLAGLGPALASLRVSVADTLRKVV